MTAGSWSVSRAMTKQEREAFLELSSSGMLAGSVYVYRRRHRRTSTSVSKDRLSPSSQPILSVTAGLSLTVTWARKGVTDTSRRHGENTLRPCLFACCRNDGSRWTTRRQDRHDRPSNKPLQQPGARAARPAAERRRWADKECARHRS